MRHRCNSQPRQLPHWFDAHRREDKRGQVAVSAISLRANGLFTSATYLFHQDGNITGWQHRGSALPPVTGDKMNERFGVLPSISNRIITGGRRRFLPYRSSRAAEQFTLRALQPSLKGLVNEMRSLVFVTCLMVCASVTQPFYASIISRPMLPRKYRASSWQQRFCFRPPATQTIKTKPYQKAVSASSKNTGCGNKPTRLQLFTALRRSRRSSARRDQYQCPLAR